MSQPNPHRDEPPPDVTRAFEHRADESAAVADGPRPYVRQAEGVPPRHRQEPSIFDAEIVPEPAGGAHRTVQLPHEDAAEVTTELPPVPPDGTPADSVPLLDLLAPREPAASPYVAPQAEAYRPVAGDYQPVSGAGWDGGYPDAGTNTAYVPGTYPPDPYAQHARAGRQPGHVDHQVAGHHVVADQYVAAPRARRRPVRSRRKPGAGLVAGAAAGVLLLAVVAVWALTSGSDPDDEPDARGGSGGAATSAAQTSTVLVADGYQFVQVATRNDTDCAANAYGKVADFFRATPCAALDRALYTTTVDGRPAAVSVSLVRMPDAAGAGELRKLADTSGTGNVADLLRAGVTAPGAPPSFTSAGYASELDGATVVITEADFADPAVEDPDALDRLSRAAVQLRP